jgi:hypothetical protein
VALYQDGSHVTQTKHTGFDAVHSPGVSAPNAGIYRCTACGHEIGIAEGHTLPSQLHAQHPSTLGPIKWKLLVFAVHNA